jgi:hypothetical protein
MTEVTECKHQRTASPTFMSCQCICQISFVVFVCVLVFGCKHCARKWNALTLIKLSWESCCLTAWPVRAIVLEEPLLYPEDGDGMFLINVAICRPNYTTSHSNGHSCPCKTLAFHNFCTPRIFFKFCWSLFWAGVKQPSQSVAQIKLCGAICPSSPCVIWLAM